MVAPPVVPLMLRVLSVVSFEVPTSLKVPPLVVPPIFNTLPFPSEPAVVVEPKVVA